MVVYRFRGARLVSRLEPALSGHPADSPIHAERGIALRDAAAGYRSARPQDGLAAGSAFDGSSQRAGRPGVPRRPGNRARGIIQRHTGNFAPRIGMARDPFGDSKTSIRASGDIFWGSISSNTMNLTTDFQPADQRAQRGQSGSAHREPEFVGLRRHPYRRRHAADATRFAAVLVE